MKRKTEDDFSFIKEQYPILIRALQDSGMLSFLPSSGKLGVLGLDNKEFPVPTSQDLERILSENRKLVYQKRKQGFTELLLTPLGMAFSRLIEITQSRIIAHAKEGKILKTRRNPNDPELFSKVRIDNPIWIWEKIRLALDTPQLTYFPKEYSRGKHLGKTKKEVGQDRSICPISGWSIGLIEPIFHSSPFGEGKEIFGRPQLMEEFSPREYLRIMQLPAYVGETGWVLEDFLTYFLIKLETTSRVSHDRWDENGLWLTGSYLPNLIPRADIVLVGFWDSFTGKLRISGHRTGNKFRGWGARSIVRLGKEGGFLQFANNNLSFQKSSRKKKILKK
ncbi:MAG: hypothetical protein NUV68_07275 [Caldiserica bacterium]|jgi:hypothetical protein|nr:hypothetical protein [Caldisericota bacterium]MDH7563008.1 hypothetical protein [Caldisericota bacterium]